MRRLVSIIAVSSLLLALVFTQRPDIGVVEASPDVYQGDVVLTGNDVYVIENQRFDINGSIIVEENATLVLRNAMINFTQTENYEHNMTFRNPLNGNPRLQGDNTTITASNRYFDVGFWGDSTAITHRLETASKVRLAAHDSSVLSLSNANTAPVYGWDSSVVNITGSTIHDHVFAADSSTLTVTNSTLHSYLSADESSVVKVSNSTLRRLTLRSGSVDCRIFALAPGFFSSWNYSLDCSMVVAPGGYAPEVALNDSQIEGWKFDFLDSSNATIFNSTIEDLGTRHSSVAAASDSTIGTLYTHQYSVVRLVNSTCGSCYIYDESKVYVGWYLDVHVVDSIAGNVPSADVTATYPNATVAGSELTGGNGWARLTLMEKMVNATGEYPVGTYTVEASYEIYSNSTAVDMAGNQIATLVLSELLIAPWDMSGPTVWVPDGKCDIRDVALAAKLYGSIEGDERYDVRADITGPTYLVPDGKIDMRDVALVAKHFGEIYV